MTAMRQRRKLWMVGAVVAAGWCCTNLGSQAPAPPQAAPRGAAATTMLVGTASCAGRSCHGDLVPAGEATPTPSRFSYSIWCASDPHAEAFASLQSAHGRAIAERLGIADAAADQRCLACHVNPRLAAAPPAVLLRERSHGVGCESCHGPAASWLEPHQTSTWQKSTGETRRYAYAEHGMTELSNLLIRAQTCAGCHVGAPADAERGLPRRDVNHDFIAAGHPALRFEFSAYQANLPRHWAEKNAGPDFEVRSWTLGQLATADAALALRADRAADRSQPWPEFAEFSCFACHHDLSGKPAPGAVASKLRWSDWYLALAPVAARSLNGSDPKHGVFTLPPNLFARDAVAQHARAERARLVPQTAAGPLEVKQLRTALVRHTKEWHAPTWDQVEQLALALAALDGPVDHANRPLQELAFLPGTQGPRQYRPQELAPIMDTLRKHLVP